MLTDSEVDRRFSMLVADLNSAVRAVDWRGVNQPADRHSSDAGIVAVRLLAVAVALVTSVVGVLVARTFDLGVVAFVVWFAVVVPGTTLATLLIVDRLRRPR